ncbi:hypothetical protein [Alkaliphilus pronyensis]|nr:hypothetical protein [Alkaliphilus pronyensis]
MKFLDGDENINNLQVELLKNFGGVIRNNHIEMIDNFNFKYYKSMQVMI